LTKSDLPHAGLSDAQWERLTALATSLTAEQSNWVGGYFTGFAAAARGGVTVAPPPPPPAPSAATSRTLTVLYASETGNGIELAEGAAAHATSLGLAANAVDVAEYKPAQLKDEQDLLIVTSTHGEGEPPQPALGFFEFLASRKAPRLEGVRFAVMALGDSTYEHFCEAGKILDRRFEELGAARLEPRIDCDVDQLKAGKAWAIALLERLDAEAVPAIAAPVAAAPAAPAVAAPALYGEENPFLAEVLENTVITGRGSSKETRHLELRLEGSGITYEPGDALGVVGRNDRRVVDELLDVAQLAPDTVVVVDGTPRSLGEALERDFEVMAATPRFLTHWAGLTDASELQALSATDRAAERTAWLKANHVVDILRQFPVAGLEAETFVAGLRRLQPRFYSIASSQAAQDGDVHLTVSTVRYDLHGTERRGVVSGSLGEVEEGATLPVFVRPNPHFRLPADVVPIIMIGAGTGVAPYRAFVQEREQRGATGRSWLIFGDRNFRSDFLYQAEWQAHQKPGGGLSLIDVVFSRDGTRKQYVQDRVRERATELFAWLQEGAHLYVCGDADGMAPGVHEALLDAVAKAGLLNAEAADDYIRGLQRDGRYQRDVY
jgi:sulfite reductase (NADPH) flavoprotein alpha-component